MKICRNIDFLKGETIQHCNLADQTSFKKVKPQFFLNLSYLNSHKCREICARFYLCEILSYRREHSHHNQCRRFTCQELKTGLSALSFQRLIIYFNDHLCLYDSHEVFFRQLIFLYCISSYFLRSN